MIQTIITTGNRIQVNNSKKESQVKIDKPDPGFETVEIVVMLSVVDKALFINLPPNV